MTTAQLEELVAEFGEDQRGLIVNALIFLDDYERHRDLREPIDRRAYVQHVIDLTR